MPSRKDSQYDNAPTFTLPDADNFIVLGFAADLGTCTGKAASGAQCRNFVNLQGAEIITFYQQFLFNIFFYKSVISQFFRRIFQILAKF